MEEICHKLVLKLLKYIPFIIAIFYFIDSVLNCFGIIVYIVPDIFYMSPITALFMIIASFAFRFCIWHRLPIYYSMILHLLSAIDYYFNIGITNSIILFIIILITIIFIILGMYLKNRYNKMRMLNVNE